MGQMNFAYNFVGLPPSAQAISTLPTMSIFAYNILGSISLLTQNIGLQIEGGALASVNITANIGLYSLTGSTLSLANSLSATTSASGLDIVPAFYLSLTATSATQNITPGTWYWGMLISQSDLTVLSTAIVRLIAGTSFNFANAFPGAFIGGAMTASTNAIPASIATSDLDIPGGPEMQVPMVLLSA